MAVGGPQLVISKHNFAGAGPTQPVCVGLMSEWLCGDGGGTVEFVVVWRRGVLSICTCGERGESNAVSPELGFHARVEGWWSTAGKAADKLSWVLPGAQGDPA